MSAKRANREVIIARLCEMFGVWRERGDIAAAHPRIAAELCFGLVEAALRECYVAGLPSSATENTYVAEVARCIQAILGLRPSDRR